MILEKRILVTQLITDTIKNNIDMEIEEYKFPAGKTKRLVEFNSFTPITELLTHSRRSEVIQLLSKILGIDIWTTDYVTVEKTIKTKDMSIGLNSTTYDVCRILIAKLDKEC